jgi:hypothetical protein
MRSFFYAATDCGVNNQQQVASFATRRTPLSRVERDGIERELRAKLRTAEKARSDAARRATQMRIQLGDMQTSSEVDFALREVRVAEQSARDEYVRALMAFSNFVLRGGDPNSLTDAR